MVLLHTSLTHLTPYTQTQTQNTCLTDHLTSLAQTHTNKGEEKAAALARACIAEAGRRKNGQNVLCGWMDGRTDGMKNGVWEKSIGGKGTDYGLCVLRPEPMFAVPPPPNIPKHTGPTLLTLAALFRPARDGVVKQVPGFASHLEREALRYFLDWATEVGVS